VDIDKLTQQVRELYGIHSKFDKNFPPKSAWQDPGNYGLYDVTGAHAGFDKLMLDLLRELGATEAADIFENADRWYE